MPLDEYARRELRNQIETRRHLAAEFAELANEERPDREFLCERSKFHLSVAKDLEKQLRALEEVELNEQLPDSNSPTV